MAKGKGKGKGNSNRKRKANDESEENSSNNVTKIIRSSKTNKKDNSKVVKTMPRVKRNTNCMWRNVAETVAAINPIDDVDNQDEPDFDNLDLQDENNVTNPNHVKLAVDANDENEFATDDESETEETEVN